MATFTIHTKDKNQSKILKAFLKAVGFDFQVDANTSSELSELLLKGQKEFEEGKTTSVKREELKKLLDL
jgi:hypothetical protein